MIIYYNYVMKSITRIEKNGGPIKIGGALDAENSVNPPKNDVFIHLTVQIADVD